jgi:hypothetical protein
MKSKHARKNSIDVKTVLENLVKLATLIYLISKIVAHH